MSQRGMLQLLLFSSVLLLIKSQPTCNGIVSFEKISRREPNAEKVVPSGVLLDEPGHVVAIECLASCLRQPDCYGLTVDYSHSRCSSFAQPPQSADDFVHSPNNFFQKICYRNISLPGCGPTTGRRFWTMDQVMGALLDGFIVREFRTTHRLGCSKECLTETSFNCSSASYEQSSGRCLLSKESRRSQPQAYRETYLNGTWTYMESACIDPATDCAYDRKKNKAIPTVDLLIFAENVDHCEAQCRNETRFLCRSYSFLDNRCSLSSDDRVSSASLTLPAVPDSTYGELVCPTDDCSQGSYLYEKVMGHSLETGEEEMIPVPPLDCEGACDKLGFTCRAAAVDYARNMCLKLDRTSQGRSTELKPQVGRTLIEKTCLHTKNGSRTGCSGSHGNVAFVRVPGIEFPSSSYPKTYELIQSRQECQQKCYDESSFTCKSVFYDEGTAACKLSAENLHSLPRPQQVIRNGNYKTSHMEYMCRYDNSFLADCGTQKTDGQRIIYVDKVVADVSTVADCETTCRQQYDCMSFGYNQELRVCSLSSVSSRVPDVQMTVKSEKDDYYEFDCIKSHETTTSLPPTSYGTTIPIRNVTTTTADESTDGTGFRTNMSSTESIPPITSGDATISMTSETPLTTTSVATPGTVSVSPAATTTTTTEATTSTTTTTESATPSAETETNAIPSLTPDTSQTTVSLPPVSPTVPSETEAVSSSDVNTPSTIPTTRPTTEQLATTQSADENISRTSQTQASATEKPQITPSSMPTPSSFSPAVMTGPNTATNTSVDLTTETSFGTGSPQPSSAAMNEITNDPVPTPGNTVLNTATTASSSQSSSTNTEDPLPTPITTESQTIVTPTPTTDATKSSSAATEPVTSTTSSSTTTTTTTTTTATTKTTAAATEPTTATATTATATITTVGHATANPITPANVTHIPGGKDLCPKNYVSTYERIPGFEPVGEYYFTLLCGSEPSDPGIVHECSILCSERSQCRGFVVDHQNYLCYGLIADNVIQHLSLCVAEAKDFFYRICIPSSLSCDRIFTFDRIVDQAVEYNSIPPRYTIPFISKEACKCLCLEEKKFTCRSLTYEHRNSVCRIYDQSRTHISLTFSGGSEFFENTCASPARACSYIRPETDVGPISVIKSLSVRSLYECKWACDSSRSFHCRSFNFVDRVFTGGTSNLCLLYSDNQMTVRKGSLRVVPRSLYYQKVCT